MDLLAKERDRVLQRAARAYGLGFTVASVLCFVLPGAVAGSTELGVASPSTFCSRAHSSCSG